MKPYPPMTIRFDQAHGEYARGQVAELEFMQAAKLVEEGKATPVGLEKQRRAVIRERLETR